MKREKIDNFSCSPSTCSPINFCQKHFRKYTNNHLHKSVTKHNTEALMLIASAGYWNCDIGDDGIIIPTGSDTFKMSMDKLSNKHFLWFKSKNNEKCLPIGAGMPILKLR